MAQEDSNVQEQPKKSKVKLIVIAAVVVALVAGGGAYYFLFFKKDAHASKELAQPEKKAPVFVPLESFVVNLHADSGEHYVQTELTIQVDSEEDSELIKAHMPEVRNRIINLLTSKRTEEILTPEGKDLLNKEIIAQMKAPFSGNKQKQKVMSVFYTSFVVQ